MKSGIVLACLLLVASFGFAELRIVDLPNCKELSGYEKMPVIQLKFGNETENLMSCLTTRVAKINLTSCLLDVNITFSSRWLYLADCPQNQTPTEPKTECPDFSAYQNKKFDMTHSVLQFGMPLNMTVSITNELVQKLRFPTANLPPPPEQFGDIYMTVGKAICWVITVGFTITLLVLLGMGIRNYITEQIADIAEERMKQKCKNYKKKR